MRYASFDVVSGWRIAQVRFGKLYYTQLVQKEQIQVEYQLRRKDGSPVWCSLSGKALNRDRLEEGVVWVLDDLGPRKKLEEKLQKAAEEAKAANRSKSEFLANMSHEIRTPLNGIMGMLQLMQTTPQDKEQEEYSLTAVESCKRLTQLLGDILDLSKIDAGRLDIVSKTFSLKETVDSVYHLFNFSAEQSGLQLLFDISAKIPDQLIGDNNRLHQILNNLVGNALKFTKQGKVLVEAYPLPAPDDQHFKILFSVSDTGMGIPNDKIDLVFEAFSQADSGYSRQFQGAGLGLSIVKKLVNLMGGNVSIDSALNKGTTIHFCITFKLPEKTKPVPIPVTTTLDYGGESLKVLLVEDDRINQIAVSRALSKQNCIVSIADDGAQAIAQLKNENFDLIFMDIQMPIMDGIEATSAIRQGSAGKDNINIPIVALTAHAMEGDEQRIRQAGMDFYLAKPVDFESIRSLLGKWRNKDNITSR